MSKFSRRKLMAACAGAMLSKMPLGAAQEPSVPVAAIDIHHHMLPPFYKPAVLEWLGRLGGRSAAIDQWTPERSIAALDEAAKARAVLSISTPAVTLENRRAAIEMAHRCNDYGAELSERYPDRLAFFATLPMPDVDASLGELERSSKLPRAAGAVLLTSYDGRYLGEPAFDPLFEELDRRRALVFVHPTAAPCCFGLTPEIDGADRAAGRYGSRRGEPAMGGHIVTVPKNPLRVLAWRRDSPDAHRSFEARRGHEPGCRRARAARCR